MNLVEEYITNITHISESDKHGFRKVTADYNCYGRKEVQVTKAISDSDWKMIQEKGYRLC